MKSLPKRFILSLLVFIIFHYTLFTVSGQTPIYQTGFEGSGNPILDPPPATASEDYWVTNDNSTQRYMAYDECGYCLPNDYGYGCVTWQLRNTWCMVTYDFAFDTYYKPITGNRSLTVCMLFGENSNLGYYYDPYGFCFEGGYITTLWGGFDYWSEMLDVTTDRWAYRKISTSGFQNINLRFDWKCWISRLAMDRHYGMVGYSPDNGVTWRWLNYGGDIGDGRYWNSNIPKNQVLTLPSECDNNPNLMIAFRFFADANYKVSDNSTGPSFTVDNLYLTGDVITTFQCAVPQNFNVSIGSPANGLQHHLNLSWNPVTGAEGYDIEVSANGSTGWTNVFEGNALSLDYNAGDNPNRQYFFRARAYKGSVLCDYSGNISRYTACDIPNLAITGIGSGSVTLRLMDESPVVNPDYTTYAIYCTTTGQWVQAGGTLGSIESYYTKAVWGGDATVTVSNLNPNTQYCFYAVAKNMENDKRSGYTVCATTSTGCFQPLIATQPLNISRCTGFTGIVFTVGASGTEPLSYQWVKNEGELPGQTNTALSVTNCQNSDGGIYYCRVKNSCGSAVSNAATLIVSSQPSVTVSPASVSQCPGTDIVFYTSASGTPPISFQWYKNGSPVGTGDVNYSKTGITAGDQGTYTCIAGNICGNATSNNVMLTVNPLPVKYSITGSSTFCAGSAGSPISLTGSQAGVSYQLLRNGANAGDPVTGTGSAISFGNQTLAGYYTVIATNISTGCVNNMDGSIEITIYPLPRVYTVTGGGSYCTGSAGVSVGLSNSQSGVNYQLLLNGANQGTALAGTGTNLSFGVQGGSGTYTVVAVNQTTGCTNTMTGSVTVQVNPLPDIYNVTGGGSFCADLAGTPVGISGSQTGVNYQLRLNGGNWGSPAGGTGAALNFGVQTNTGVYSVYAINASTGCTVTMNGSVSISVNQLPVAFAVTGGGSYCAGGAGLSVGLSNTQGGVNYQLKLNGVNNGSTVAGNGSYITFGNKSTAGTYTVTAVNTTTGCTNTMTGSAEIIINPIPVSFNISGGGAYCSGGSGAPVGLTGSQAGVSYQLLLNGSIYTSPFSGSGSSVSFGNQTGAGTYTAIAVDDATGCSNYMSGFVIVSENPLPVVFSITGGGTFCTGGSGVTIGLSSSQSGINYQLMLNGANSGAPIAGTGSAITFGTKTTGGTYSVVATNNTTGCTSTMAGSTVINTNSLPAVFNVSGGGATCPGGAGVTISLSGSETDVSYQLLVNGINTGSPVYGTGSSISFSNQTEAGTYTMVATNTLTGCSVSMTGSALITASGLPTAYNLTGGGAFCSGQTGVLVGLAGSQTGITYQLRVNLINTGSPLAGNGSPISFGIQISSGNYTVVAINTSTGCSAVMSGSVVVTQNPLPNTYTVSGGGAFCTGSAGVSVNLNGSQPGVSYQLMLNGVSSGSPFTGTGSPFSFSNLTNAGTYTVAATNTTSGCVNNMFGSAIINVYLPPTIYSVTGGGAYCSGGSGVAVSLAGSQTNTSYQLKLNGTNSGSPFTGTGSAITFGNQTSAGTYTIAAVNTFTCSSDMNGSVTVIVNPLPTAFSVSGGGAYCADAAGIPVTLSGSQSGVSYQLKLNSGNSGAAVPGTGNAISFGDQAGTGTYTVTANNTATGCTNNMTGSVTVSINPLPTVYNVTGGGAYCSGGSGVAVNLSGSQTGVNYQLKLNNAATGSPAGGTGSAFSFGNQTNPGVYSVVATNSTTGCSNTMTGSVNVSVNPLPDVYTVTGGGAYCSSTGGIPVFLNSTEPGVSYQLQLNGVNNGLPVNGTGSTISFGSKTNAGTYTVIATNNASGCIKSMTGSAVITINQLPLAYTVSGGGAYCAGGTGVLAGLTGSQTSAVYQLFLNGAPIGSPVAGTGSAISFGLQTGTGTYTVIATNTTTGCTNTMNGSTVITMNVPPVAYNLTGGGSYCTGSSGVQLGLAGSQAGVNYQLKLNGTNTGNAVAGTGLPLNFGTKTTAGTYTVYATNSTTGCAGAMTGSAVIVSNPIPAAYLVTGGGTYCSGGSGVSVGLTGSQAGVNYQLMFNGSGTGTTAAGTGTSISFGNLTGIGTYTVTAVNATSGCTNNMSNSAVITVNPPPVAYNVTGGGFYCSGGTGVAVNLAGSQTGVSYQLQVNGINSGTPVTGTGSSIGFGNKTASGTYTVVATIAATGCTTVMNGYSVISIYPLPVSYNVTGGGSYCTGGSGSTVGLSDSESGVNYQLLYNGSNSGSPVAGSGAEISFGYRTTAGTYTVVATNTTSSCSSSMAGNAVITISGLPSVYNTMGGGSYCSGGAGIAVSLSGSQSGVSYQLQLNAVNTGSPVAGTGALLSFGSQTNAGTYTIVATNQTTGCSNNMNGSAVITINPLPADFAVTGGGSYCSGGSGVSIWLAGSQAGVNYQLKLNGINTGSPVAGNGSGITFGNKTAQGTYTVFATNGTTGCSSPMQGNTTVTITSVPGTPSLSSNSPVCEGSTLNLNATLISGAEYNWTGPNGFTSSQQNPQIPLISAGGSGTYSVFVSINGCNSQTSSITITVNAAPYISSQPADSEVCSGESAGFSITAEGSGILSYQWFKNSYQVPVTGNRLTINDVSLSDAGTYSCVVRNVCGNVTSNAAALTINVPPVITFITQPKQKCSRDSVLFRTVISSQSSVISYQWMKNSGDIQGATNSVYIKSVLSTSDAGTYTCSVSNKCGTTSAVTSLTVNSPPLIVDSILNHARCEGESISFSFNVTGTVNSYQWTKGGASIAGATKSDYTINSLKVQDGDVYSCIVSNNCGSSELKPFLLTIYLKPVISIVPLTITKSPGDSVSFYLSPGGTPPFLYQWRMNNNNIYGANDRSFSMKSITCEDAGVYSCVVKNNCGSSTVQCGTLVVSSCSGYSISGYINYNNKLLKAMYSTNVYLKNINGDILSSVQTDNSGVYQFINVSNGEYRIECTTAINWGGANPLDALYVNRNYIGTYNFGDALKKKAADVNLDNKVNPVDALSINRRFTGLITQFTAPDWMFEAANIIVNGGNVTQNIKAICAGDVDGSYNP